MNGWKKEEIPPEIEMQTLLGTLTIRLILIEKLFFYLPPSTRFNLDCVYSIRILVGEVHGDEPMHHLLAISGQVCKLGKRFHLFAS